MLRLQSSILGHFKSIFIKLYAGAGYTARATANVLFQGVYGGGHRWEYLYTRWDAILDIFIACLDQTLFQIYMKTKSSKKGLEQRNRFRLFSFWEWEFPFSLNELGFF